MKALSLTQPWASLVAIGAKRFETRSWQPYHYGQIAIHASKGMPTWVPEAVEASRALRRILDRQGWTLEALPRGAVIAVARLEWAEPTATVYLQDMLARLGGPDEHELGDFGPGRWAWYLADARPLPDPIPAQGSLGIWEWTPPAGWCLPEEVRRAG